MKHIICSICGGIHEVVFMFGVRIIGCYAVGRTMRFASPNDIQPIHIDHDPGDEDRFA